MKIGKTILLGLLLLIPYFLFAQESRKGKFFIGFSAGGSFANFINSEAPHKINLFGSNETPYIYSSDDVTKSPAYIDYQTGLFSDILIGVSAGVDAEFFIRDNLSICSGLIFETKGINLHYSNNRNGYVQTNSWLPSYGTIDETFNCKIINNYFISPLMIRKYFFTHKNIFFEGGTFMGYLLSSRITYLNSKTLSNENGLLSKNSTRLNNQKDLDKKYTHKYDFGLSVGSGFIKSLSNRLVLKTELRMNIGLLKLDSKYNNEYMLKVRPSGSNFGTYLLRSTNYYGLNSNSKNINLVLTIGLGYKIGK